MASALGRPIKVDTNTLKIERGKFARVCVEIDLTMPVVGKIWVNGHWYKVQYEGLHLICTSCGCYGHLGRNCPTKPVPTNPAGPPSQHAAANSHGESSQTQHSMPTTTQLIPDPENGKAVSIFPNKSSAHNDKIISNDEGNNELHGDWLLVTRKKRILIGPTSNSTKSASHNCFTALNNLTQKAKPDPPYQPTNSRPYPIEPPRATKNHKDQKRRRHDDDVVIPPNVEYSFDPTRNKAILIPSDRYPKAPSNKIHVAKINPQISINKKTNNHSPHILDPIESNTAQQEKNHDSTNMNISSPIQTEQDNNIVNNADMQEETCDDLDDVQEEQLAASENHDSKGTGEEDMVT